MLSCPVVLGGVLRTALTGTAAPSQCPVKQRNTTAIVWRGCCGRSRQRCIWLQCNQETSGKRCTAEEGGAQPCACAAGAPGAPPGPQGSSGPPSGFRAPRGVARRAPPRSSDPTVSAHHLLQRSPAHPALETGAPESWRHSRCCQLSPKPVCTALLHVLERLVLPYAGTDRQTVSSAVKHSNAISSEMYC